MDKITYSQSRIKHYFKCPKSFELSRKHKAQFGTSTDSVMRDGNLFEGYVLGFKPDQDEKELIGRKKKPTIDLIKGHADYVKSIFEGQPGEPYKFISHDNGDFVIRGELDYIGHINQSAFEKIGMQLFKKDLGKVIIDLKYTKDIPRVWDAKQTKEDYFQSLFYTYLVYLTTGELLPFFYVIVENKYETPLVRIIEMQITKEDIDGLKSFINELHQEMFFQAVPTEKNCLGSYNTGRCWFLEHCPHGRKLTGGIKTVNYSGLYSIVDSQ